MTIKITVLRDVISYSLIDIHKSFGGSCCLDFQGRRSILKMEPAGSMKIFKSLNFTKMLVQIYQTMRNHILESSISKHSALDLQGHTFAKITAN
jgi:hypothetical protein